MHTYVNSKYFHSLMLNTWFMLLEERIVYPCRPSNSAGSDISCTPGPGLQCRQLLPLEPHNHHPPWALQRVMDCYHHPGERPLCHRTILTQKGPDSVLCSTPYLRGQNVLFLVIFVLLYKVIVIAGTCACVLSH